jgi:hypothetical protein
MVINSTLKTKKTMKTNDMVIYPKDWGLVNRRPLRYNQKLFCKIRRALGYHKYHMLNLEEVCAFVMYDSIKAREIMGF